MLVDRSTLNLHRKRVQASKARFLWFHELVADEISSRIDDINQSFSKKCVVCSIPEFWQSAVPSASVILDIDNLGLMQGGYDLIIHAMSLHWANDPVGQLIQCQRALEKDGLLMAVLFGGDTLVELRTACVHAETKIKGGISPRVLPMGNIMSLGNLLQRAGIEQPVADRLTLTRHYNSTFELMHELRSMGETNAMVKRQKTFTSRSVFNEIDRFYNQYFKDASGKLTATFELIFLTGWNLQTSRY